MSAGKPQRRLLAVFAHPDDETFQAGPLLAKCAAEGMHITLVCATPPVPAHPGDPADLRRRELQAAAIELGIQTIDFLGYREHTSGPPDARSLLAQHPEALRDVIAAAIARHRPDAVLTDSSFGGYGHPDHIAVHAAVRFAVVRMVEQGSKVRLYALAYPWWLRTLASRKLKPLTLLGDARTAADVRIDVAAYLPARKRAARAYRSQIAIAPLPLRLLEALPAWAQRFVFGRCDLTQLVPWPPTDPVKPTFLE